MKFILILFMFAHAAFAMDPVDEQSSETDVGLYYGGYNHQTVSVRYSKALGTVAFVQHRHTGHREETVLNDHPIPLKDLDRSTDKMLERLRKVRKDWFIAELQSNVEKLDRMYRMTRVAQTERERLPASDPKKFDPQFTDWFLKDSLKLRKSWTEGNLTKSIKDLDQMIEIVNHRQTNDPLKAMMLENLQGLKKAWTGSGDSQSLTDMDRVIQTIEKHKLSGWILKKNREGQGLTPDLGREDLVQLVTGALEDTLQLKTQPTKRPKSPPGDVEAVTSSGHAPTGAGH